MSRRPGAGPGAKCTRGAARKLAILSTLALLPLAFSGGCGPRPATTPTPDFPPVGRHSSSSLLAVGDTGAVGGQRASQLMVGRAMQQEHERAPVDAFVLLGDNFYPDGLRWSGVPSRVRDNVVSPYCAFVELEGRLSFQVEDACDAQPDPLHPVPIYAVLGNHDYDASESPTLQRLAVPWFVSNWTMPIGLVQTFEIGGGMSLVAFDSIALLEGADPAPLLAAIRSAPGPWRVLATHHPIASSHGDEPAQNAAYRGYLETLYAVLREAAVPVQLVLSGHEHLLAATMAHPSDPPLNVIAGSGSETRVLPISRDRCLFWRGDLGFARVDLVEEHGTQRLIASLISVEAGTQQAGGRTLARWSIDATGRVEAALRQGEQP
jgi:hypothetical protein